MDLSEDTFKIEIFEQAWEDLSEEKKIDLLRQIPALEPEEAIVPVLAGILSLHFHVRSEARKNIGLICNRVNRLFDQPDTVQKGWKVSDSICARLYDQIRHKINQNDQIFFFRTLMDISGRGPFYAFKAVCLKKISVAIMEKIIVSLPDEKRLAFVDQYIQTDAAARLKLGFSFVRILKSISSREAVLQFYAGLFDMERQSDPFLNNIPFDVRRPETIISTELRSPSPEIQSSGLKALSMMEDEIPHDLLKDLLESTEVKKVRIAVYNVIENAPMGTYPALFNTVWEKMCQTGDQAEGFHAFKALVVTGRYPVHEILGRIHAEKPDLMPVIEVELSSLSRLSFFVLQDIALNKSRYVRDHFRVNLACVFGLIKKRPERIVRKMKKYDSDASDEIRLEVTNFIEKTRELLLKEKKDIECAFDDVVEQVKNAKAADAGLLKKLFSGSVQKKIEALNEPAGNGHIDFSTENIASQNFSSRTFHSPAVYFSNCIFQNCDLSASRFLGVMFKKTSFYNVDFRNAIFENANFDRAVLINVNAGNAVFRNCSFQGTSFFNCNFNRAAVIDSSFCGAVISKTVFGAADLSFTSFAYSKISAVSFVSATLNHTFFTDAKARFCRFPSGVKTLNQMDGVDFNARAYQLSFKEMPTLQQNIVDELNMLLFCEFIHYGEKRFLKQNQLSRLTAFDIFKPRQADLFQIVPFLLHENVAFPGIGPVDPQTPCGIHDYVPELETMEALARHIQIADPMIRRHPDPVVEGLFTIGSVGSLAQTEDSDIDYWVCIDEQKLGKDQLALLQQKLENMEKMVATHFDLQVTFFLVDIHRARDNDFGDSTIESSGSAQARLLKEEFYRTMIHVAGKIPLWAVLPSAISLNYYNNILAHVGAFPNLARYIDLGDIHAISFNEYYGASIWQMFKWLKSPFKSVIKMALLEKYIYEYGKKSLLCNRYKDEWMNSGTRLRLAQNDSYFILLENLIQYYEEQKDLRSVQLLLTCFFLKLGISKDAQIDNSVFGLRKILLEKCMEKWSWDKMDVFRIGDFKSWTYSEIIRLSTMIEKYMVQKYKTVNKAFENQLRGKSQISAEDRTVLGRKIFIEFSKQPEKVEKVLLVSRSNRHFQGLHLKYVKNESRRVGTWTLVNRQHKAPEHQEELLVRARTIEEIGAWLLYNGLYDSETVINLVPNPTYVTFDDIRKLYKALDEFFAPIIKSPVSFDELLKTSRIICLFVSVNFYAPRQQTSVSEYTAIYMNSWGEMFCKSVYTPDRFASMEPVKKDLLKRLEIEALPMNTAFYFSKGIGR